jgi:DNA polymerase-1
MQQIPRPEPGKPNLREVWVPDNDQHSIAAADYSQHEVRIAAQIVGDRKLIEACQSSDTYSKFGSIMYHREITKQDPERQLAKSSVLATIFGAGANRIHNTTSLPVDQCEEMRQAIFGAFPGVWNYRQATASFARKNGYVLSLTGRRRYVLTPEQQDTLIKGGDVSGWWTNSQNGPIQTSAADMMKKAMGDFWEQLEELRDSNSIEPTTRMWYTLHDEFGVHCHDNDLDTIVPLIKETMEDAGHDIAPNVKHIAEVNVGKTWFK